MGHSAKATTLGDRVHQQEHSITDNSSQNHPGGLPRSSPSMVIDASFLPTLHATECPSEVVTGPSLTEEIADLLLNPMFKMPGNSSTCNYPYSTAKKEGNPPVPGEALQGYLKQPPPSPHGSSQADMADLMAHSCQSPSPSTPERGTSPTPLSHHWPTPSTCWWMYCAFRRRGIAQWSISSQPGPQWVHATNGSYQKLKLVIAKTKLTLPEAIREIKAWYATTIRDAENAYRTAIRKADGHLFSFH